MVIESMSNTHFEEILNNKDRIPRMSEFIQNPQEHVFIESPGNSQKSPVDFGDGSEQIPQKQVSPVQEDNPPRLSSKFEDSDLKKDLIDESEAPFKAPQINEYTVEEEEDEESKEIMDPDSSLLVDIADAFADNGLQTPRSEGEDDDPKLKEAHKNRHGLGFSIRDSYIFDPLE